MLFDWHGAWASVIHHPLFGIGITLGAYQLVLAAFEKTRWIFLQPVLVSMLLVIGVLVGCGLTYAEYRKSTEILSILLGPATVALAVPLYLNLRRIRQLFWPIFTTLVIGGVVATGMPLISIAVSLTLGVWLLSQMSAVAVVQAGFAVAIIASASCAATAAANSA